jgi:hypothetical protein
MLDYTLPSAFAETSSRNERMFLLYGYSMGNHTSTGHPHNFHTSLSQPHNTLPIRYMQVGGVPAKSNKETIKDEK